MTSTLTRLGCGVLVVSIVLVLLYGVDPNSKLFAEEITLWVVIRGILFAFGSVLMGGLAVFLGSLGSSNFGNEATRVDRLTRIGAAKNVELTAMMRDATIRFEAASGLIGAIVIVTAILLVAYLFDFSPEIPPLPERPPVAWGKNLILGVIVFGAAQLLKWSVNSAVVAIDLALDKHYPKAEMN
ncbi:hypothetical protein [Pseudooceanicola nanhaiensis]|uniref:hypothetical protein n=1 Tax=Pseudooceanicola nanhaiensis TaxID=375761 RepID=UPI001CD614A6|nr:hypothetical protein [Pseudooceanicola nanhaiensis]MCA0919119.1 hypothetical protein [Pseudooceanicola nanhaiensis]